VIFVHMFDSYNIIFLLYRMGVLAEKSFFKEEVQADLQYTCQVKKYKQFTCQVETSTNSRPDAFLLIIFVSELRARADSLPPPDG